MNRVYRAVESRAHGLLPFRLEHWAMLAACGVGLGLVHPVAGGAGVLTVLVVVVVITRRWNGRREWLWLWWRRKEARHYRVLDRDGAYRPYAPRNQRGQP